MIHVMYKKSFIHIFVLLFHSDSSSSFSDGAVGVSAMVNKRDIGKNSVKGDYISFVLEVHNRAT